MQWFSPALYALKSHSYRARKLDLLLIFKGWEGYVVEIIEQKIVLYLSWVRNQLKHNMDKAMIAEDFTHHSLVCVVSFYHF